MGDVTMEKTEKSAQGGSIGSYFKANLREYGLLLALIFVMVSFQIMTGGILMKPLNLTNLVLQNSYVVIMAIGMLLVIVAGHIDLSVGSVVGFIGALAAVMIVNYDIHYVPTVIVCLMVGTVIGAMQGFWVAYYKIPAFIVTLAGMLVFRGLTLALLQGQSIGPFPSAFQKMSSGFIPDLIGSGRPHILTIALGAAISIYLLYSSFKRRQEQARVASVDEPFAFFLGKLVLIVFAINYLTYIMAGYKGYPNVLIVMAVLMSVYSFITTRTTIGRRIYALGGNEKAAKLSGVNTARLTFLTFANMGLLAAFAGLVFAARLNTATPKAGFTFELDVIAAVFIGGASMSGGVGTVIGAIVGAFLMGVMNNGMSILSIGIDYQQVIKGLVLLAAVIFDVYNKNKAQ
ncbi:multiple monosaccharide ABC transporter membrane protein [Cohaesibacter sp. ES.047]|uniref:multiple monosaccharide ABC transporter permease n=1 Tax=Cohaesibacter sp. ES.047 TaxID=1798205 RepID=UPI000BB8232E|nr:multiple monosaccharide ABC transporter permease [Cohaesibacter sp. ES.047]SNY89919.1 multiple monosaccharide ABC transporter membrane protein [Cohaesibacter sp. ES.047]SNY90729.1 multiple monosaccharide ABC transporter membrane protein [Cohaesibacter sp. ES.047]